MNQRTIGPAGVRLGVPGLGNNDAHIPAVCVEKGVAVGALNPGLGGLERNIIFIRHPNRILRVPGTVSGAIDCRGTDVEQGDVGGGVQLIRRGRAACRWAWGGRGSGFGLPWSRNSGAHLGPPVTPLGPKGASLGPNGVQSKRSGACLCTVGGRERMYGV